MGAVGGTRTAHWSGRLTVLCTAVAVLLLASVLTAQVAFAHAVLVDTDPADGAELDEAPAEISLLFNEPVGLGPEAVRVFDASGARVDEGEAGHGPAPSVVRVGLRNDLGASIYTVTWRAISADGHVVRGASSFTVGDPGQIETVDVAVLPGDENQTRWEVLAAGARWLTYLGTLLAVGVAAFLLFVHDRAAAERRRLVRLVRLGAVVAIIATAVAVPIQAIVISGAGLSTLLDLATIAATSGSTFGTSALVRITGLAILLVAVGGLWRGWAQQGLATGALIALLSFLFAGHTVSTEPRALVLSANLTHTAAASVWFGGLVALIVVLRARWQASDPEQSSAAGGARLVARFSVLAAVAVLLVAASGTALAWAEVRSWAGLFATTYGWTLLAKIALVAAVLTVAAYNNRRLVPAIRSGSAQAWQRLSRTVRWETTGIVAVVVVTAFLVSIPPGRVSVGTGEAHADHQEPHTSAHSDHPSPHGGAYSDQFPLGPNHQVHLVVDPAAPGSNEVTLHLLDAAGRPADIAQAVELRFSLPEADIAPLARTPEPVGPGHYRHTGPELAITGMWDVKIRVLVSDFERLTTTAQVPIGPTS